MTYKVFWKSNASYKLAMSLAGSRLTRQSREGDGEVVIQMNECGSSLNMAILALVEFFGLDALHSHVSAVLQ